MEHSSTHRRDGNGHQHTRATNTHHGPRTHNTRAPTSTTSYAQPLLFPPSPSHANFSHQANLCNDYPPSPHQPFHRCPDHPSPHRITLRLTRPQLHPHTHHGQYTAMRHQITPPQQPRHHTVLILQPNSRTISFKPQNTGTMDKSSA